MKNKFKQISAIIAIGLLVLMYLLLLVFAIFDFPNWQRFFFACLGATVIVPLLLWVNMFVYDGTMKRRKIAEDEGEMTHGPKIKSDN